jgi:hypothetical protein
MCCSLCLHLDTLSSGEEQPARVLLRLEKKYSPSLRVMQF